MIPAQRYNIIIVCILSLRAKLHTNIKNIIYSTPILFLKFVADHCIHAIAESIIILPLLAVWLIIDMTLIPFVLKSHIYIQLGI